MLYYSPTQLRHLKSPADLDALLASAAAAAGVVAVQLGPDFGVRDEHVKRLVEALGLQLQSIRLGSSDTGDGVWLTDAAVHAVIAHCGPTLRELCLESCTCVTDAAFLAAVEGLPNLQVLGVTGHDDTIDERALAGGCWASGAGVPSSGAVLRPALACCRAPLLCHAAPAPAHPLDCRQDHKKGAGAAHQGRPAAGKWPPRVLPSSGLGLCRQRRLRSAAWLRPSAAAPWAAWPGAPGMPPAARGAGLCAHAAHPPPPCARSPAFFCLQLQELYLTDQSYNLHGSVQCLLQARKGLRVQAGETDSDSMAWACVLRATGRSHGDGLYGRW